MSDGARILIVEDEQIVAKDLAVALSRMGYVVMEPTDSGAEAIRLASDRCPDLVLMDVRIKGRMDGIEAAGILRRRYDIPVVYLTAYADDETISRAKATEPHGYILKPFNTRELRSIIEIALYKHEMESRLRERERWFSTTLRSIADAVVAVDELDRITFMNVAAESLLGIREEQARGRAFVEMAQLKDARSGTAIVSPLKAALTKGQEMAAPTHSAPVESNGTRVVDNAAASIVTTNGKLLGAVAVFRDVGDERRLRQQLAMADRLASLATLAGGVAHEINNPLAAVFANVDYLVDELQYMKLDLESAIGSRRLPGAIERRAGKMKGVLEDVREGAQRIRHIVDDLRVLGRPVDEARQQVNVRENIEWAIRVTGNDIRRRARLVQDLESVPPVEASEIRLGQVFVNLLLNAAQAIPEGAAEAHEVRVTARTDARGWVVVAIHDSGSGIPADVMERIFEPFFTTKNQGAGNGLGLAVCNGIVRALGGEIRVESAVGRGSTFEVVLPPAATRPTMAPPTDADQPALRGRILLVEEDPLVARSFERTLAAEHEVATVHDAREALRLVQEGRPCDLVLCDLMMPDISGVDFYEKALEVAPALAAKIVFITGGAFTPRAADFLKSVPNAVLQKPVRPTVLLALVQKVLREQAGR